jgi:LPXTG-motif cell wall-anchored protein
VSVVQAGGFTSIKSNPVYLSIAVLALLAGIMLVLRFRKKIQQRIQLEIRKRKN